LKKSLDEIPGMDDFNLWESGSTQHIEMMVTGDEVLRVRGSGAVNEFVIVGIGSDYGVAILRVQPMSEGGILQRRKEGSGGLLPWRNASVSSYSRRISLE
jgi:hypothetical protein